jgi:hypothetical protein
MRSVLLCLTLAACASNPPASEAPDAYRAAAFQPPPPGATLTLLPPQETQYDELREGAEQLHKQLQKQLLAAGYQVIALKKDDYVRRWNQEAANVGGVYQQDSGEFKDKEYTQALSALLRNSCELTKCAMLIDARLVVRPAELVNGMVEWDGRRQASGDKVSSGNDAPDRTYAISVEIAGIQPDSNLAFKAYGGAVVPAQYSMDELQNFARKPLSWDSGDLDAGLRIALRPLLEKPTAPKPAATK